MVWRNPFDWAHVTNVDTRSYRHVVGEGALRGRSPRTREGRIGPTAQLQWSVVSEGWDLWTVGGAVDGLFSTLAFYGAGGEA